MRAQWARLNSGEWGVKVFLEHPFDSVDAGDTVTVTKKDGEQSQATIERVLWTGDDAKEEGARSSLCAIRREAKAENVADTA